MLRFLKTADTLLGCGAPGMISPSLFNDESPSSIRMDAVSSVSLLFLLLPEQRIKYLPSLVPISDFLRSFDNYFQVVCSGKSVVLVIVPLIAIFNMVWFFS